jgi:hypothetical protein
MSKADAKRNRSTPTTQGSLLVSLLSTKQPKTQELGHTDGGTFIPCTQWAYLAPFDRPRGGSGPTSPSAQPPTPHIHAPATTTTKPWPLKCVPSFF